MKNFVVAVLVLICVLRCTNEAAQSDKKKEPLIARLGDLNKTPKPVDYVTLSDEQFRNLFKELLDSAVLDTTTRVDYTNGTLISSSPHGTGKGYWIHPPLVPFSSTQQTAAAIINDRLVFFGICPDDRPTCPDFPPRFEIPDTCEDPPCSPNFGVGDDFIPIPRPACNAIVSGLFSRCADREECERSDHSCQRFYRQFEGRYTFRGIEAPQNVSFIYIWCDCDCS